MEAIDFVQAFWANSSDSFLVTGDKEILTVWFVYSRKETGNHHLFGNASKFILS